MNVLSIQSHVAYGHVGNASAVFPMQRLGVEVWPLSRNPKLIVRGEDFFQRFGPWAVFLGRFFGPIRAVIALIAGIFLMPQVLFQAANLASASVWAFVILAPGAGLAQYLLW